MNKLLLLSFVLLLIKFTSAQVVRHPDPGMKSDPSKATLIITPCVPGYFYLDDKFLTELNSKDTVYVFNIKPATYSVKLQSDSISYKQVILLEGSKHLILNPCKDTLTDSLILSTVNKRMHERVERKHPLKKNTFFNITQINPLNVYLNTGETYFFHTFTTINGYQVVPGFCAGIGLAYSYYRSDMIEMDWENLTGDVTLQFLPLFVDLRTHFPPSPSGRVYPFLKFDIGYNFSLNKSSLIPALYTNEIYSMKKGGIYISPGFGLRIFASDLIQVMFGIEYSYEKSTFNVHSLDNPYYYSDYPKQNEMNFFKIFLGVAFQYK